MDKNAIDRIVVAALGRVKGILEAFPLTDADRRQLRAIEEDAEKRSLMGLGKVVNTGVIEVLSCDLAYGALNNMDFEWSCQAHLALKKGEETVGEEIHDPVRIAELSTQKNVWFMHRNFVVYKDRVSFPQDIMNKICHFEIPGLPATWCSLEDRDTRVESLVYANPATPADIYLKETYFQGRDERGLGTILVGVRLLTE